MKPTQWQPHLKNHGGQFGTCTKRFVAFKPDRLYAALTPAIPPSGNAILDATINSIADQLAERLLARLSAYPEQPRITPVLLAVRDAAIYLGRSEQSIQHLIFEKELPVVRVGRRVHLDRRDLDIWIEKNKY